MPAVSKAELIEALLNAFASSNLAAVLTSAENQQPLHFSVSGQGLMDTTLYVHIKTFTPAKRKNPDEYRIQLKQADLPLLLNPAGPTLLLGYYEADGLFAGFNPLTVPQGTTKWVSAGYMSLRALRRCRQNGFTFDRDRNGRIAVGIPPNLVAAYALTADSIFENTDTPEWLSLLREATTAFGEPDRADHLLEQHLIDVSQPRAKLVRQIRAYARSSRFKKQVLRAYNSKCAVTGAQLGLIDAAHILPVGAPGSTDLITNGIALSPNYHRAFDAGLIYLSEDLEMRINPAKVNELRAANRLIGLEQFQASLGRMNLPVNRLNWPDPAMIRRGNEVRKIRL